MRRFFSRFALGAGTLAMAGLLATATKASAAEPALGAFNDVIVGGDSDASIQLVDRRHRGHRGHRGRHGYHRGNRGFGFSLHLGRGYGYTPYRYGYVPRRYGYYGLGYGGSGGYGYGGYGGYGYDDYCY
jgi:hypothetical protein